MKHFRNLGILAIAAFSFFYTEKIANLTLDKNELYQSIKEESSKYNEEYINAFIEDDHIVPGLNGKTVNIKNSFYNMKDLNAFNSYYLIYDTSYPEITIENNKDKIVERGNEYKRSVSFILEYNENIIKYFKDNNYKGFTNKEYVEMGKNIYHHNIKSYKKLIKTLKNFYVFKNKDIKFIDDNIVIPYLYNSLNEEDIANKNLEETIISLFEFKGDKLKNKMLQEISKIRNEFPLWEYRGFTKTEVNK